MTVDREASRSDCELCGTAAIRRRLTHDSAYGNSNTRSLFPSFPGKVAVGRRIARMRNPLRLALAIGTLSLLAFATPGPAIAQWIKYPNPGTPRTTDGKPNLMAPPPKKDGKPDLSGIWKIVRPGTIPPESGSYASLDYWMTGSEKISMHSWAETLFKRRYAGFGAGRPSTQRCHARHRRISPCGFRTHGNPGDHRRSKGLDQYMVLHDEVSNHAGYGIDRRRLRKQQRRRSPDNEIRVQLNLHNDKEPHEDPLR